MSWIVYKVLREFAVNTDTGAVNIGGLGTIIGTFKDTFRPFSVGNTTSNTLTTDTTYTFKQPQTSVSEAGVIRPLSYANSNIFEEQTDTEIDNKIIDLCLDEIKTGEGIGCYKIQTTTPTGGTWTSITTFEDKVYESSNTVYTLWRKTNDSAPSTIRPLKWNDGSSAFQEMSDANINTLVAALQNRILDTGIGLYVVATAAPGTGTWQTQGNPFSDTRHQRDTQNYTGFYAATYQTNFSGFYSAGFGLPSFQGFYTGFFTGPAFQGSYSTTTIISGLETVSTKRLYLRTG